MEKQEMVRGLERWHALSLCVSSSFCASFSNRTWSTRELLTLLSKNKC